MPSAPGRSPRTSVGQAAAYSPDIDAFNRDFAERLRSLAHSHDVLVASNWEGAPIDELVQSQLAFLGRTDQARVEIEGKSMMLAPEAARNFGLALHEFATNAVKHGALSMLGGKIRIDWATAVEPDGVRRLVFRWSESGAVTAARPGPRGFGQVVLEDVIPGMFGGRQHWTSAPRVSPGR